MKVGTSRFIEEMRVEDRRVIELSRPCPPSIAARDAWRARAANRVLRCHRQTDRCSFGTSTSGLR